MAIELTEALLSQAAGWDVMKMARAYLEQGKVLSSFWEPPLLRGVVQIGDQSIRASFVIKNAVDIDNLCQCPDARRWGKICAHGVAVGLHWLRARQPLIAPAAAPGRAPVKTAPAAPVRKPSALLRYPAGEPAELSLILPQNFEAAATRGKIMLVLEAVWDGGRCPLNALPKGRPFAFGAQDLQLIDALENLTNGEPPAVLQLDLKQFAALLPGLTGHPAVTLGKSRAVTISATPAAMARASPCGMGTSAATPQLTETSTTFCSGPMTSRRAAS